MAPWRRRIVIRWRESVCAFVKGAFCCLCGLKSRGDLLMAIIL
jgi:hypothetical protein